MIQFAERKFDLNIVNIGFHTEHPFKYLTNFRFDERVCVSYNYLQQLVPQQFKMRFFCPEALVQF